MKSNGTEQMSPDGSQQNILKEAGIVLVGIIETRVLRWYCEGKSD